MKRVNGKGALAGLVSNYFVTLGLDRCAWPGKPHVLLYGFLGGVVCLTVAVFVSWLTGGHKRAIL